MPPRIPIFNMFGPSPLGPLQVHMGKAHECVRALMPFFEATIIDDWDKADTFYKQIVDLENKADALKSDYRLHLPKDLFLPVARGDLLMMMVLQDRIANRAKDIAGLIKGRQMHFPAAVQQDYVEFLSRCIEATDQAYKAISELEELLETGFRGKEASLVEQMIVELDKIENDTDQIQIKLRRKLFAIEKDYPPVDVIFFYKAIEWTGDLADRAQTVGGQLQLLLAH